MRSFCFFFSSRRRHTRFDCDWSSDLCSSDLLDLDLVIPNPGLSLKDGAVEPWTKPQHEWAMDELRQFCKSEKISMTVPFAQLSRAEQRGIIEGKKDWSGVRGFFDWLETQIYKL